MKITTYENSVKHGVLDTLKREDFIKDFGGRVQDAQRIVTAPVSIQQQENQNESAEATAVENAEKGAKSLAGAFRDFAKNEIERISKKGIQSKSGQTAGVLKYGTTAATRGVKSAEQQVAGKAVRGAGKVISKGVKTATKKQLLLQAQPQRRLHLRVRLLPVLA